MVLPIYAYGQPVLKKVAKDIDKDYPELEKLLADMWETMYNAQGVGLAAPQIGRGIRLFLVDSKQTMEEGKEEDGIKQVFINAEKIEETGEEKKYEEGCLSIPDVRGDVKRPNTLTIRFLDENFEAHTVTYTGINARVVQHEYDHIEGLLFTEKLKPIKKRLIKRKLENIKKGKIRSEYKMKFFTPRR
ncbi:MAG: peptide deformylase [Saprospiraceae bacterium]